MHTVLQDLRYSVRQMRKSPGFALTGIISLALGIGATTAVFSVIYAALINPYPYPTANRIVRLDLSTKEQPDGFQAYLDGDQVRQVQQIGMLQSVLAMDYHAMILSGGDVPENVDVVGLISNGFDDLGMHPLLGRGLLPSDAPDGQDPKPVVLLSYAFWRSHYLGNPGVLGKSLQLDHTDYVIVGVAAPRFAWYHADVWIPLKLNQDASHVYTTDLLLKPGVTNKQVDAALQPLIEQFAKDMPKAFPKGARVRVQGLNQWVIQSIGSTLYLLFGAVALLLVIACANVSILLLARGNARQHELAVRSAVGARRGRILRQLFTESLLLALVGCACGIFMSYAMLKAIKAVLPPHAFAPEVVININAPVLATSVCIGLATGVVFGLWPALRISLVKTAHVLATGTRRVSGSVSARRSHNLLIASQIACTLLLLAAAGSATQGFLRILHKNLGYDPRDVLSVAIPMTRVTYRNWEARANYIARLRANVANTPGVALTAISTNATPPGGGFDMEFSIQGQSNAQRQHASIGFVNSTYFEALRIPLIAGRVWSEAENRGAVHVAIVNRTFAQRFFPHGNAIGHSVRVPGIDARPPEVVAAPQIADSWLQIVGVVADVANQGLEDPVTPAIYVPYTFEIADYTQILVRSNVEPLTLLHAIKLRLAQVDPNQQTYSDDEDLESWISSMPEWQNEHLAAWAFGIMSWLALILAAIGLYSVVSYTVVQRTNEFGIRMALGAQPWSILRIVLASVAGSVGAGVAAGLVLTFSLNRVLAKWIVSDSRDPLILLFGVVLLTAVAAIACTVPASHAARIEPMAALREN